MRKGFWGLAVLLAVFLAAPRISQAQARGGQGQGRGGQGRGGQGAAPASTAPPAQLVLRDGWGRPVTNALKPGENPAPAPKRSIAGTWMPADGPGAGIQANGPRDMPYDGKP